MKIDPLIRDRLAGKTMILGVGAQKAGSTWMFNHLARDPDVLAAPLKEMHFFNAWLSPWRHRRHERGFEARARALAGRVARRQSEGPTPRLDAARARVAMSGDRSAYLRWFADRAGDRRCLMEMTPCYALLSPANWRRVAGYFDAAGVTVRPLFLLRDPLARMISHHRSAIRAHGAGYDVHARVRRDLGGSDQYRRSRYDLSLRAIDAAFGPDRAVVGFYETIFDRESGELERVRAALGLSPRKAARGRVVNPSPDAEPPPPELVDRGRAKLAPAYDEIRRRFGDRTPASWL